MPIDLFEASGVQASGPVDLFAANGITTKPSLTLGQRFNEALKLPESYTQQSTMTKVRELPSAALDVAMQGLNAMYSIPAKVVRRATAAPFVGTERAEQLANETQQQLTVKPLTAGGEAAMQVLSSPFTILNSYLDEAGGAGYLGKVGLETILAALPLKGITSIGGKQAPRQAPFTEKNLVARQVAEKYDLPAYPKTLSNKPALQGVVNAFQDKVVPLFEQTHNVVRDLVETVKEGYKTVDEQGNFLGTKGAKYDEAIAKLPETLEMPKLKEWMGKQITKLRDLQTKRALKQSETDLLAFYERVHEGGTFTPQTISEINGKNPMTGNQKAAAKWRMYEDMKAVPNGDEALAMLKETNTEYGITTKSRIMTNFLDKVMSEEGRVNPAKWNQLYNNFKLQNIAKMKDAFGPLDEVNEIVKSFGKELQDYNKYSKAPAPGGLEKALTGVASLAGVGGLGSAYLGVPSALPLALSGLALGTKYIGGKVAKGASRSGKMKFKGEAPFVGFKDQIYDR